MRFVTNWRTQQQRTRGINRVMLQGYLWAIQVGKSNDISFSNDMLDQVRKAGQCDLLHVDLFHNGINVLRDGGSFSYNCDPPWQEYFTSNAAHNTIQFDEHDQMPKLSRFLLAFGTGVGLGTGRHDLSKQVSNIKNFDRTENKFNSIDHWMGIFVLSGKVGGGGFGG